MDFIQDHLLSLILFSPTVAAIFVLMLPRKRVKLIRWAATLTSLIPLGLAVWLWFTFDSTASGFQFVERAVWY